jgi:hypothetical protein
LQLLYLFITTNMNSLDLAFKMASLDAFCEPPTTLDCSGFDKSSSFGSTFSFASESSQNLPSSPQHLPAYQPHPSMQVQQQQFNSGLVKGFGSSLSRSRCVTNLSSLGSVASETSIPLQSSRPTHYESGPNEGSWGYFVDSVME